MAEITLVIGLKYTISLLFSRRMRSRCTVALTVPTDMQGNPLDPSPVPTPPISVRGKSRVGKLRVAPASCKRPRATRLQAAARSSFPSAGGLHIVLFREETAGWC